MTCLLLTGKIARPALSSLFTLRSLCAEGSRSIAIGRASSGAQIKMGKPVPERGLFIDGKWQEHKGKRLDIVNPADGSVIGSIPSGGKADIDAAVDAALKAFPEWSKTTATHRAELLRKIAAGVSAALLTSLGLC